MILIVTYDLKTPKDYHNFYEAIKAQGAEGKWWHYMASTWLLSTTKSPQEVVDAIRPYLDQQDLLFVCELSPNYQGWLPKPAWDWINAEIVKPQYDFLKTIMGAGQPTPPPSPSSSAASILGGPKLGRPGITPPPPPFNPSKKPWER